MVNILIIEDNLHYAINLMNQLNKKENIKVLNIAKDGEEALNILTNKNDIDLILLDLCLPIYTGYEILKRIKYLNKYEDSCIIVSGRLDLIKNLTQNSIINTIIYKTTPLNEMVEKIDKVAETKENLKRKENIKNAIIQELLYLGYDLSRKGTQYLIETIEYIINTPLKDTSNLEKKVYPIIAKKYNVSIYNIKSNINRANNEMYCVCEVKKLKKYFNLEIDMKPKIKFVINIVINKIT